MTKPILPNWLKSPRSWFKETIRNTQAASQEFLRARNNSTTAPRQGDEALSRFAEHVVPGFPEITEDGRVLDRSREIYDNLGALYENQLDQGSFNRDTDRTPAASANPSTSAPPTNAGTYGSSISAPVQPVAGPSRLGNAGNSGALVPYGRPLRREDAVIINPETGNRQPRPLRREGAMYLDDELPITAYPIPGPSKRVKSQVAKMSTGSGRPPRKSRPLQQQQHGVAGVDTGNRFIPREGTVYFEPDYRAVETSPRCDISRFDPSYAGHGRPLHYPEVNERIPALLVDTDPRSGIQDLPTATTIADIPALFSPALRLAFNREAAPSPDVDLDFSDSPLTPLSSDGTPPPPLFPPPPAAVAPLATSAGSEDRKGKKRARDDDDEFNHSSASGSASLFGTRQFLTIRDPNPNPRKRAKYSHHSDDTPASTPTSDRKGKKRARDEDEDEEKPQVTPPKVKAESDSDSPSPSKKLKIIIPPRSAFTTPTRPNVMSISHLCGIEAGPSTSGLSASAGAGASAGAAASPGSPSLSPLSPPPSPAAAVVVPPRHARARARARALPRVDNTGVGGGDCIARRTRSANTVAGGADAASGLHATQAPPPPPVVQATQAVMRPVNNRGRGNGKRAEK